VILTFTFRRRVQQIGEPEFLEAPQDGFDLRIVWREKEEYPVARRQFEEPFMVNNSAPASFERAQPAHVSFDARPPGLSHQGSILFSLTSGPAK